jgi:hypothetical protein
MNPLIEVVKSRIRYREKLDLLMGARYCVGPGTYVRETNHVYRLEGIILPAEALPMLPDSVAEELNAVKEETRLPVARIVIDAESRTLKYVEQIAPSEQGNNGSASCIKAMLKILSLVGGDIDKAWPLALHYNRTRCVPPWDEDAENGPDSLKRKLSEAVKFWRPR